MICTICNKDYNNLGVHMYHKHKETLKPGQVIKVDDPSEIQAEIQVDEVIKEKPLSILVSEIKELLKPYQNELIIRIAEKGGKMKEIEIIARIQL